MRSLALYRELLDHVGCGVMVLDAHQRIELCNDWLLRCAQLDHREVSGREFGSIFPEAAEGRCGQVIRAALSGGRSGLLSSALHERPLLKSASAPEHSVVVHAPPGPLRRAIIEVWDASRDFESSERLQALEIETSAHKAALQRERDRVTLATQFDPVTGLANRNQVREYLTVALARCRLHDRMGALVHIDIDRFADINRSVGPRVADRVLRSVAARLAEAIRPVDAVARLGTDEFVVVVDRVKTVDDALASGGRLLEAFDRPFAVDGHELFLTACAGITVFPSDEASVDGLLSNAETAVKGAKRHGRGGIQIYTEGMDAEVRRRVAMHADLRRAVDNHEFSLVYQPQVEAAGAEVIGVEALLRWTHPRDGFVSPGEFIPLLEESGLITQVGAWVLRESCRQGTEWRAKGISDFRVSVNVSARQFRDDVLPHAVAQALDDTGFPAQDLELELTESLLMKDVDQSDRMLSELKRMGVRIAIDDFGTGYSSLAYLKRFPVDTLKIDRDFTRNISTNAEDLAICRTIVALGKTLELKVLAEGVETSEQLRNLSHAGCDAFQGFFFGRPMPPAAIAEWWAHRVNTEFSDRLLSRLVLPAAPTIVEAAQQTVTARYPSPQPIPKP